MTIPSNPSRNDYEALGVMTIEELNLLKQELMLVSHTTEFTIEQEKYLEIVVANLIARQRQAAGKQRWTEEARHSLSVQMKEYWLNLTPEQRKTHHVASHTHTPEGRAHQGQAMREFWSDPERAEPTKQKMKAVWTPERRAAHAKKMKEWWSGHAIIPKEESSDPQT